MSSSNNAETLLLQAIAISVTPTATAADRNSSFQILQQHQSQLQQPLLALVAEWLTKPNIAYQNIDITTAAKLWSLEILVTALQKSHSTKNNATQANTNANNNSVQNTIMAQCKTVLVALLLFDQHSSDTTSTTTSNNNNGSNNNMVVDRKVATLLEQVLLHEFPQRWPEFPQILQQLQTNHVEFQQHQQSSTGSTTKASKYHIWLECWQLLMEDCTDSLYHTNQSKISTARRRDVLLGLGELAPLAVPGLYRYFETSYGQYTSIAHGRLPQMHAYMISLQQTANNTNSQSLLSLPEQQQYQQQREWRTSSRQQTHQALVTVQKMATYMPLDWMTGNYAATAAAANNNNVDSNNPYNFIPALWHVVRDCGDSYKNTGGSDGGSLQCQAVTCLVAWSTRRLDVSAWKEHLVRELVGSVGPALQQTTVEHTHRRQEREAKNGNYSDDDGDDASNELMVQQWPLAQVFSKLVAQIMSAHIAHLSATAVAAVRQQNNDNSSYNASDSKALLEQLFRVALQLMSFPTPRVTAEQTNAWVSLWRDPQLVQSRILQPLVPELLKGYLHQIVRRPWPDDDGDNTSSSTKVLLVSFDYQDEDYEACVAELRSQSSLLFKFMAHAEPLAVAQTLQTHIVERLQRFGNGDVAQPQRQVTPEDESVRELEALFHPLDNCLNGIPGWALNLTKTLPKGYSEAARNETAQRLTAMMQALVAWQPSMVWLKFRRAQLLEAGKHYWQKSDDGGGGSDNLARQLLLQTVDSLLQYLGLPDEWSQAVGNSDNHSTTELSAEMTSLKKKTGVSLVAISKLVPHQLVDWLPQLSEATQSLLSTNNSNGSAIIPTNQLHLYEFLSCVATAVPDHTVRANFIAKVLSSSVDVLESARVQQQVQSPAALLQLLGVDQPAQVTDPARVAQVKNDYFHIFTALNRLLSVGKRCHEAARKKCGGMIIPSASFQQGATAGMASSPDEGPISVSDLSAIDPFAPLWPRFLPTLLSMLESTLAIWRPEHQAVLLRDPYQRYLYAISDDEAFLSKKQDGKTGGVFGEGGTAGSVVSGASRRDINLVPKWSGWLNELCNTCFQLLGILCTSRVLFSPELQSMYPRIVAVLTDKENLEAMEHRHFSQFIKQVIELLLVSCPLTLYATHLEPIIAPVFEHTRYRLEKTWEAILLNTGHLADSGTKAMVTSECNNAAQLAATGGEAWYSWFYAHAGVFAGDLDSVTAEAVVEKYRVELGRCFSDVLQTSLALKGDWALVLANQAKFQAAKRVASARVTACPRNHFSEDATLTNADGSLKSKNQDEIDNRKLARMNSLCHFILLESERVAGSLVLIVVQCLSYPDTYTCRRITKVCHRVSETVAWSPTYTNILGNLMFTQAVKNVVTEPKWMVGIEWDMINVIRDVYCRLVLGQVLQFGGQGPGLQQPKSPQGIFEQAKTVTQPLQGGGVLVIPSNIPRQLLLTVPGINAVALDNLDGSMSRKRSAKDQKDVMRDLLRVAADSLDSSTAGGPRGAGGVFDRAVQEESLLHSKSAPSIRDIPEKLVTQTQVNNGVAHGNQMKEAEEAPLYRIF